MSSASMVRGSEEGVRLIVIGTMRVRDLGRLVSLVFLLRGGRIGLVVY